MRPRPSARGVPRRIGAHPALAPWDRSRRPDEMSRAAFARAMARTRSANATTGATKPYVLLSLPAIASRGGSRGCVIRQLLAKINVRQRRQSRDTGGSAGAVRICSHETVIDAVRKMRGGAVLDATTFMPALIAGFVEAEIAAEQDAARELDLLGFEGGG